MKSLISLALDAMTLGRAVTLASDLCQWVKSVKVHDLVDRHGPLTIRTLKTAGVERIWVDYKLNDTPDTVAARVRALVENGAKIITVHASGGVDMMRAAVKTAGSDVEIYAITILTSLNDKEIARIFGKERTRLEIVHELALMAKESGVRTVVASALEVRMLKTSRNLEGMRVTVPGTRSAGVALGQQKRSATPIEAMNDGADDLVAGSQVTTADNPVLAFKAFADEIGSPL